MLGRNSPINFIPINTVTKYESIIILNLEQTTKFIHQLTKTKQSQHPPWKTRSLENNKEHSANRLKIKRICSHSIRIVYERMKWVNWVSVEFYTAVTMVLSVLTVLWFKPLNVAFYDLIKLWKALNMGWECNVVCDVTGYPWSYYIRSIFKY